MYDAQVAAPLVGAHAGHDRVEAREVARRQCALVEQHDPRAELFERGRHLVAHPHHVADDQLAGQRDVDHLQRRRRRLEDVTTMDVRVLDDLVAAVEAMPVGLGDRANRPRAGRDVRRRRHREGHEVGLVGAREAHVAGRGRHRPAIRRLEPDVGLERPGRVVGHGRRDEARRVGRRRRAGGAGPGRHTAVVDVGQDRDRRRGAQRHLRHDLQLHALLAAEDVALVPVLHREGHPHRGPLEVEREGHPERGGAKRQAEGSVGVDGIPPGLAVAVPVRLARPCIGRDRDDPVALHDLARVRRGRRRARQLALAEAGERADAGERHGAGASIGEYERQLHRLARHHHPVVGQGLEAEALREDERGLELPLGLAQPELDLVRRVGREVVAPRPDVGQEAAGGDEAAREVVDRGVGAAIPEGAVGGGHGRGDLAEPLGERRRRPGSGKARQPREAEIQAVGEGVLVTLHPSGQGGVDQLVLDGEGARERQQLRHPLALVHRAPFRADLAVGASEERVVDVAVDRDEPRSRRRLLLAGKEAVVAHAVDLARLPGPEALLELLGEAGRIAGEAECVGGEARRRLVVLAATRPVGLHREHDVWPRHAHEADEVADRLLAAPLLVRLLDAEREAEVHRAAEELLAAVEAVRRQQLLGAEHAERLEQLGADLVLAAVAARQRRVDDAEALPVTLHRDEAVVLVVGMRHRVHDGPDRGQLPQHEGEPDLAGGVRGSRGAEHLHGGTRQGEHEDGDTDPGAHGEGVARYCESGRRN